MQNQNTKQENKQNMATYFKNLTVNFNSYIGIKKRDMSDKTRFYKVYSPTKFKLRPRDDICLDLKFNIETPDRIEPWLTLLPSLKGIGFKIKNNNWKNNLTKDNTIQLHILNTSFVYTLDIKKKKCIRFIFLLGEKCDNIISTKYNSI